MPIGKSTKRWKGRALSTYATVGSMWKSAVCIFSLGFSKRENILSIKSGLTFHGETWFVTCDMETVVRGMYVDLKVVFIHKN